MTETSKPADFQFFTNVAPSGDDDSVRRGLGAPWLARCLAADSPRRRQGEGRSSAKDSNHG